MSENKTAPTAASVDEHVAAKANEQQRWECRTLMALPERLIAASIAGVQRRYGSSGESPEK